MPKTPPNHRVQWTPQQEQQLQRLAQGNTPTGLIAYKLGRTEDGVKAKAGELNVPLAPPNRSPYNRRSTK